MKTTCYLAFIRLFFGCNASETPAAPPAPQPVVIIEKPTEIPLPSPSLLQSPPSGFVDLQSSLTGACFDIRYHTADNFTGAPLPGYGAPGAWMLEQPARALMKVQEELAKQGATLLVYDAYRPLRGTLAMVAWAKRTNQVHLLDDGYIARRSGHNHGHTIDLTIADIQSCQPWDMGTPWDTLNENSHTRHAHGTVLDNRLLLKRLMSEAGFKPYSKEWWHFGYPMENSQSRDVPYGCQESREGAWKAPIGWEGLGWTAPPVPEPGPCLP